MFFNYLLHLFNIAMHLLNDLLKLLTTIIYKLQLFTSKLYITIPIYCNNIYSISSKNHVQTCFKPNKHEQVQTSTNKKQQYMLFCTMFFNYLLHLFTINLAMHLLNYLLKLLTTIIYILQLFTSKLYFTSPIYYNIMYSIRIY